MTVDEGKQVVEELEAQGKTKEEIAGAMYLLFVDGKVDVEGLGQLVELLGFELTPEFLQMSPEEQKTNGFEEVEEGEEEPGGIEGNETEDQEQPNEPTQDNEDDEEEKANKLFGGKGGNSNHDTQGKMSEDDDEEEKQAMKLFGNK